MTWPAAGSKGRCFFFFFFKGGWGCYVLLFCLELWLFFFVFSFWFCWVSVVVGCWFWMFRGSTSLFGVSFA